MAQSRIENVAIRGMASAVPETVRTIDDEAAVFGMAETRRIAGYLGVERRHVSDGTLCASDLCCAAAEALLPAIEWERDTIDALVFVSVTPDYITPASACLLQHRLGLAKACAAFDISHACSGYVYGLWVVSHLLASGHLKRALLLVGDTVSRMISPQDRSVAALFGDCGCATALEWCPDAETLWFDIGSDGAGAEHLMVPAGGYRQPSTEATRTRVEQPDQTLRSDEDLYMAGTDVFGFTMREVPPLYRRLLHLAQWTTDSVDLVVMHQANLFILNYLAKTMRLPTGKWINNMQHFGNTSGASIPLAMTEQAGAALQHHSQRLILLGFGTGLSWGGAALTCGPIPIVPLQTVRSASSATEP